MKRTLQGLGLEPERVKLVWASAAEGARFASEVATFVEQIRALGPLHWGENGGSGNEALPQEPNQPELQEVKA